MRRILIPLLLFSIYLFANEFTSIENSVFENGAKKEVSIEKPKRFFASKNLYLSYINYPKHVYKNQRFEIKIKALITRNNFDSIKTDFINDINMTPLNKNSQWKQNPENPNNFTNSFYFKAYEKNFKMPDIKVSLYNGNRLVETRVLNSIDITFSEIANGDNKFTNVIAKDFKLIASKSKQYTNKEALTILDIEASESNLEDFNIKNVEDQGFSLIEDDYPKQHIIYYVVIPIHKKNIVFTYYNTINNKIETVNIPVVFTEELVSTQTDLNPNNSSFEFYKKVFVGVLALLFLLIFIWKRRYYLLVLFLITAIIFIVFAMPNKTVKLKANSVIYILPTKNSTIFKKVSTDMIVENLKKRDGFIKIMFKNGNENYIGWVKEEDVVKN